LSEDEIEAMRKPELYRCHVCKDVFRRAQGEIVIEKAEGYFYCYDCLETETEKVEKKAKKKAKKK